MGLRDPTTGEELSLHEALHEIEHDLLHRSDKAEAGSPTLHAQVRQEVAQIWAAALKHTANEASEFASWTMVKECCEHLQWKKAAVRLPRASLRFQNGSRASGYLGFGKPRCKYVPHSKLGCGRSRLFGRKAL